MSRISRFCPIKNNYRIKCELENAFAKAHMINQDVVSDAKARGVKMDAGQLSRYLNSFTERGKLKDGVDEPRLSAESILWLCARYGVNVSIEVQAVSLTPEAIENRVKKFDPYDYL